MSRICPSCNAEIEEDDRFCTNCGKQLASDDQAAGDATVSAATGPLSTDSPIPVTADVQPVRSQVETAPPPSSIDTPSSAMDIVVEVETNRRHVRNHACQLRFRVTNAARAAHNVTLQMVLHGRSRHLEQEDAEIEQYCRFEDRGDQFIFSFPFRPLIPGEFPVESLRMIVSPQENPQESRVYELPDRSLFVKAADPNQQTSGPGIAVGGDIHIDFSRLEEMYGSDIGSLLNLNARQDTTAKEPEAGWQAILLRPGGTEERIFCTFTRCRRPITPDQSFVCTRCEKTVCRRHQDDDKPGYCQVCAETLRAEEFEAASKQAATPQQARDVIEALSTATNQRPSFRARIWTERGSRPTTRDIATVSRKSKGCYRVGDEFTLNVQAESNCYLTLVNIGTSGKVYVLLKDYALFAGAPVALAGPDESRQWVIGGPPGVEQIKAFFSHDPCDLFPGAEWFTPLVPGDRPADVIATLRNAGAMLEQMPVHAWTDAMAEFVVE